MDQKYIELVIFLSVLSPIIVSCTEVVKRAIPKLPTNYAPLLSVIVGMGLSYLAIPFTELETGWRLWGGFLAGLSACGLYDIGKFTIQKKI